MLNPGYYTVHRDAVLTLGARRIWLRKHAWLVTDGRYIGIFDRDVAMDWVPLEGLSGQPLLLSEEASQRVESVAVPVTFPQLERRLKQLLDTGDGASIPDMPRVPLNGLGSYLRSHRTRVAYTYER